MSEMGHFTYANLYFEVLYVKLRFYISDRPIPLSSPNQLGFSFFFFILHCTAFFSTSGGTPHRYFTTSCTYFTTKKI